MRVTSGFVPPYIFDFQREFDRQEVSIISGVGINGADINYQNLYTLKSDN